jgi:pilus assembly protein FimV
VKLKSLVTAAVAALVLGISLPGESSAQGSSGTAPTGTTRQQPPAGAAGVDPAAGQGTGSGEENRVPRADQSRDPDGNERRLTTERGSTTDDNDATRGTTTQGRPGTTGTAGAAGSYGTGGASSAAESGNTTGAAGTGASEARGTSGADVDGGASGVPNTASPVTWIVVIALCAVAAFLAMRLARGRVAR